ncbi:MAG: MerR family transcriptional regulator [Asticcacaulis sp.]
MNKGPLALRTISEAAAHLGVQQHVLRFWETKFPFIRPTKRAGGRRFYRPQDIELLGGIKTLLYDRGYTIRGVQKLFKDEGQKAILGARDGSALPTESGFIPDEEVPAAYLDEVEPGVDHSAPPAMGMSDETRRRFLDIARTLEEAQAALGRHLNRR